MARRSRAPAPARSGSARAAAGASTSFSASTFPYEVDYNDHFETPIGAYEDILPLLDAVGPMPPSRNEENKSADKNADRDKHVLYDPYYCDGRTSTLLRSLGFSNVKHEKRDFYADLRSGTVPDHHTLVTNPPYSADHKRRCLEYAIGSLRGSWGGGGDGSKKRRRKRPFFILMPNYVANKEYYREVTADEDGKEARDIVYVVPSRPYEYDHPEGTGHDLPPFSSIWFCGIGEGNVERARVAFREYWHHHRTTSSPGRPSPRLATSLAELTEMGAIDSGRRLNPRQRRKLKKRRKAESSPSADPHQSDATRLGRSAGNRTDVLARGSGRRGKGSAGGEAELIVPTATGEGRRKKKKSKHRDENGIRKRRRF